jgi:trigger factor
VESATCKRELVIEVPEDVVARERELITAQYARVARIPGFRPGHAPRSLVSKRFRDEIRSEVAQTLIPRYFEDRVREEKLVIAGEPRFEGLEFEEGQALRAKASFEVYPEVQLKETYRGVEVEGEPLGVRETEVDEAIERTRQQNATFEVIEDRPAGDEDYVMVGYKGQDLSNPDAEAVEVREGLIPIGGRGTVPEFSENLRSSRAGDVREFEVNYPEAFPNQRLRGRRIRYRVEVQGIKRKVLPAVDDELAKSVSDFATLEEFRNQVRLDLERARQQRLDTTLRQRVLEKIIAGYDFPVPETLVESQLRRRVERAVTGLASQGVDVEAAGIDWRRVGEDMRGDAERDVRGSLILERIADAEKIEVSEESIDEAVRELAEAEHEAPAVLKTRLTREDGLARLKSNIRRQKALDLIYHNAKIIQPTGAQGSTKGEERVQPAPETQDLAGERITS